MAAIYLLHAIFVFNKKNWGYLDMYCSKIFMSILVVLNVWEQFEVQNLDIFGI